MCPFTNNESSSHKKKNWDDSPKKNILWKKKDHKVNIINLHVLEMGQTYWSEEQKKKSYRFFPRQHTVTYFYFKYFK